MSIEEIVDPSWTVYPDDIIDKSTLDSKYIEYRPEETILNSAQNDNVSQNFTIVMDNHQANCKLSNAVLDVRYKIVSNATGADLASTDVITIGANAQLMFREAHLVVQEEQIEDIQFPGYANTIRSLMEQSAPYIQKNGPAEGLWLERARSRLGDIDDITTNPTVYSWSAGSAQIQKYNVDPVSFAIESKSQLYNDSYAKRFFQTQGSKIAEVSIPLRSIFKAADAYEGMLKGVDIKLLLTKQSDYNLVLHGQDGAPPGRLVITDLRLRVPQKTPSAAAALKMQEELNSGAVRKLVYPNWHTRFSQNYTFSDTYQKWKVNTLTRPPTYAFVMFQLAGTTQNINDAPLATIQTTTDGIANPLKFKSAANDAGTAGFTDINRVTIFVAGERKPEQDWRMDFTSDDFSQVFSEFLRVTGKAPFGDSEDESFVNAETFKLQYPIFAFDLRDAANKFFGEGPNSVDLEVEWQLESGATSAYRAVVVYADERCLDFGSVGGRMLLKQCN